MIENQKGKTCAIIAVLGLLFGAGVLLVVMVFSGAGTGRIARSVPEDTAIFVSVNIVRNAALTKKSIKTIGEDNYKALVDDLFELASEFLEFDARELWESAMGNITEWIGPEIAVAVPKTAITDGEPELAFIIAARKPKIAAEGFKEVIELLAENMPGGAPEWSASEREGVEILCADGELCFAVVGRNLFIATPGYLKRLIDFNQDKKARSLAQTDHFKRVTRSLDRDTVFYAAFNIELFHDTFRQMAKEGVASGMPEGLADEYKALKSAVIFVSMDNRFNTGYKLALLLDPDEAAKSDIFSALDIDGHITIKGSLLANINDWTRQTVMGMYDDDLGMEFEDDAEMEMVKALMEYNQAFYEAVESYTMRGTLNRNEASLTFEARFDERKLREVPWDKTSALMDFARTAIEKYKVKANITKCRGVLWDIQEAQMAFIEQMGEFAIMDELYEAGLFSPERLAGCSDVWERSYDWETEVTILAVPEGYTEEECLVYIEINEWGGGWIEQEGTECGPYWGDDEVYWPEDDMEDLEEACETQKDMLTEFVNANPEVVDDILNNWRPEFDQIMAREPLTPEDEEEIQSIMTWIWFDVLWEAGGDSRCAEYYVEQDWAPDRDPSHIEPPEFPDEPLGADDEAADRIVVAVVIHEDDDGKREYSIDWFTPWDIPVEVYSLTVTAREPQPGTDPVMWEIAGVPADLDSIFYGAAPEGAAELTEARPLTAGEYDFMLQAYSIAEPDYSSDEHLSATGVNWLIIW